MKKSKRLEDTSKKKRPRSTKAPIFEPKWNASYKPFQGFSKTKQPSKGRPYTLRNDVV